jgi:hypothetical protein
MLIICISNIKLYSVGGPSLLAAWAAQFGIGGYSSDIAALRSYAANLSLMPEQAQ